MLAAVLLLLLLATCIHAQYTPNVQLYDCSNPTRQSWIYNVTDKTIRLTHDMTFCLDIEKYGTADGSNVWAASCHLDDTDPTHQNQEWELKGNQIISTLSGKCLDVDGDIDIFSNVQIYSCNASRHQQWLINAVDSTIRALPSSLCLDAGTTASCETPPFSSYKYCDVTAPLDDRVADLVSRLTLTEKATLMQADTGVPRLAVPPLGHTECTHGTLNNGDPQFATTLFPQAITVARTWDPSLLHSVGRAISDEVRGKYNLARKTGTTTAYPQGLACWAPVLNLARSPLWGRNQEGYGESPFLQGEMAHAYITALQNRQEGHRTTTTTTRTAEEVQYTPQLQTVATAKHFDVHGGPENIPSSRFSFDSIVSDRDWIESFQPAFKKAVEAGVESFMCSYNAINGVPSCANNRLLTKLLRDSWNFTGFVVSDCGAVSGVYNAHHFAQNDVEAASFCLEAGCDWACDQEYAKLQNAVEQGMVTMERLDVGLSRTLKGFFKLGLFDGASVYDSIVLSDAVTKHQTLARTAAQSAVVLLENRNGLLPISTATVKTIALVGPCIDAAGCFEGDYNPTPRYVVTPAAAFNNTAFHVTAVPACKDVHCEDTSGFLAALTAARASDLVVFVGGIDTTVEREGLDRTNITLPGAQELLLQQLVATGTTVVVVLAHGSILVTPTGFAKAGAVVSAGYGGQEAGHAIVDVLTGTVNPSGKTVCSWYTNVDQVPPITSYDMSSPPGFTYKYNVGSVFYHFGYGLSYTTFILSDATVSHTTLAPCDSVDVTATLKNTGSRAGSEVLQVYVRYENATVPTPHIKLVGFFKVALEAGESKQVAVTVAGVSFSIVTDYDATETIEPGHFTLFAATGLPTDPRTSHSIPLSITIAGEAVPVATCDK